MQPPSFDRLIALNSLHALKIGVVVTVIETDLLGTEELEESVRGGFSSLGLVPDRSGYRRSFVADDDRFAFAAKNHGQSHIHILRNERIRTIINEKNRN